MFKDKNILFLVHNYSSFQKDQIDFLAQYFKNVYVVVRYKPIAEISNFLNIGEAKMHTYKVAFNFKNKPDNVKVYPMPLWYLPLNFFYKKLGDYAFKKADAIIRKNNLNFDVIFSFFFWTSGYVGNKLKQKYTVPHIVSGRGEDVYDYPFRNTFWKNKIREVIDNADLVTTVSNYNNECIKKIGANKEAVVIPNGFFSHKSFPIDTTEARLKLGLSTNQKIILTVGFLGVIKGQKHLIDAIYNLKNEYPDIKCYIVGEGELRRKLQKQINTLGMQNSVKLVGYVKNEDVNTWINAADIFVLPSLGEGYPNVMNECLACGKPFIGTSVGAMPDIIQDENIGYICKTENAEDLAEKMRMALKKDWDRGFIARFAEKLSYEKVGKQYLSLFAKLVRTD